MDIDGWGTPAPKPKNIDLTLKQRAAVQQIQADTAELNQLHEREQLIRARINANRGRLELIAELAEEYRVHEETDQGISPVT